MKVFRIFSFLILLFLGKNNEVVSQTPISYRAYIFLAEGCPMCQGYAATLNQLAEAYEAKGVQFIGIFPNFYTTDAEIEAFKKQFDIRFDLKRDECFIYSDQLKATTTPQVFLTDKSDKILYSGMIDNAYFQRGKRRGKTSDFYLKNALDNVLKGQAVAVAQTTAIGCIIVRE